MGKGALTNANMFNPRLCALSPLLQLLHGQDSHNLAGWLHLEHAWLLDGCIHALPSLFCHQPSVHPFFLGVHPCSSKGSCHLCSTSQPPFHRCSAQACCRPTARPSTQPSALACSNSCSPTHATSCPTSQPIVHPAAYPFPQPSARGHRPPDLGGSIQKVREDPLGSGRIP